MITNQNNYLDKNHKSVIKPPQRKSVRWNHLQLEQTAPVHQQKSPLVSSNAHGCDGEAREYREVPSAQIQPPSVQCKQSRIPTTTATRNFNQISRAPTNLWNGIYEKHLLNQTKFDQTVDDKWANKCASNERKNSRSSGVSNIQPPETNFNNNLCQNELRTVLVPVPNNGCQINSQYALLHQYIDPQLTFAEAYTPKKSAKIRLTNRPPPSPPTTSDPYFHKQINTFDSNGGAASMGKFLSEMANKNAASNFHLGPQTILLQASNVRASPYKYSNETQIPSEMGFVYVQPSIIEKQKRFCPLPLYNGHNKQIKNEINDVDCQLYKNTGVLNQAYNRISGNICLERGQRIQPVGGNHYEDSSAAATATATLTTPSSCATKTASLSVVSAVQEKVANNNTFENAITASMPAPGGESTLATNSEYTSNNSKINIMLETAQAMAAAAYFARLVLFHNKFTIIYFLSFCTAYTFYRFSVCIWCFHIGFDCFFIFILF